MVISFTTIEVPYQARVTSRRENEREISISVLPVSTYCCESVVERMLFFNTLIYFFRIIYSKDTTLAFASAAIIISIEVRRSRKGKGGRRNLSGHNARIIRFFGSGLLGRV